VRDLYRCRQLSVVAALTPCRQQFNRFQFLIGLLKPRNALLALVVLHVVCKAVDVGVVELFARHQIGRTFEEGNHFLWQFVGLFLAAYADLGFCRNGARRNGHSEISSVWPSTCDSSLRQTISEKLEDVPLPKPTRKKKVPAKP